MRLVRRAFFSLKTTSRYFQKVPFALGESVRTKIPCPNFLPRESVFFVGGSPSDTASVLVPCRSDHRRNPSSHLPLRSHLSLLKYRGGCPQEVLKGPYVGALHQEPYLLV